MFVKRASEHLIRFMKPSVFLLFIFSIIAYLKAGAQNAINSQFFTGIQLVNVTTGKQARQPVIQVHEEEAINISRKVRLGADVNLMRNTIPYSQYKGKVLEFIQLLLPLHLDYKISEIIFLESGVYLGAIARSSNVYITEFVQVRYFETLQAFWDAGLMTGVSFNIQKLGKVNLRYNHGLLPSVPINEDEIEKNRMLAVGLTIIF